MKKERERPENGRGGPGSQGERLKNGWEVVGEERAEPKNWREETKFGSARSAERFAAVANEGGEAASSGAESRWRGASARLRMPSRGWPCGIVSLGTSV
jgi:hypothetical protein